MDARMTKAEAALLLPSPNTPVADRIEAIRLAAAAARDATVTSWLGRAFHRVLDRLVEWQHNQLAMRELNALTDRELADIGLTRGDLPRILAKPARRPARKGAALAA
jgi:uncharacterized protein YjiS (DUF1127 family)